MRPHPPRSLAIVNIRSGVTEEHIGQLFEVIPNKKLSDQYLNLQVVLMVHRMDNLTEDIIPFVQINLGDETISKEGTSGRITSTPTDRCQQNLHGYHS